LQGGFYLLKIASPFASPFPDSPAQFQAEGSLLQTESLPYNMLDEK
jgi:hypothetical protein